MIDVTLALFLQCQLNYIQIDLVCYTSRHANTSWSYLRVHFILLLVRQLCLVRHLCVYDAWHAMHSNLQLIHFSKKNPGDMWYYCHINLYLPGYV